MKDFKELGISSKLITELEQHGIVKPTLVQEKTIPLVLKGKDVMVQSETGSGKTIGFAVPTIDMVKKEGKVQVLVITPTRELAKQISEEYEKFSKFKDLKTAVVYGGVSINNQAQQVRISEIVVGTPGRLLDLLNRRLLNLTYCSFLVIDEADRLMDMGFIDDINAIIKFMPVQKQSLMFSATINSKVLKLMETFLNNPVKIMLENIIKRGVLKQYYYNVSSRDKISLLVHLLKTIKHGLTLVFCNTKRQTRFVAKALKKNGINAEAMNGDMTQFMREKVLRLFGLEKIEVLVATDVAARGIHIEDITHVFNYDLPDDEETYTHRVGRTARNGKTGTAIILLSDRDFQNMDKIKKAYRGMIDEVKTEEYERIKIPVMKREGRMSPRRSFNRRDKSSGSIASRHLRRRGRR
ncbi:MAG: DEAD/DEAH box helicase [Nanoarchaeota archaeon]|nr:DEAD/DEAH box helicase [Nanoarchaeota archaeon]